MYRITINCCLDFIKHKNSKKRFFIFGTKSDASIELHKISDFDHPGIVLENKENAEQLLKLLTS